MTRESAQEFLDYQEQLLSYMEESLKNFRGSNSAGQHDPDPAFNGLAVKLFNLQFRHNPVYHAFCQFRQIDPSQIKHWRQIPALPTSAFKELDVTSLSSGERTAVFHSSGTTRQRPSRHFHSAHSLALYEASLLKWFDTMVMGSLVPDSRADPGYNFLILTPPLQEAPHSSLVHMFHTLVTRYERDADSSFAGKVDGNGCWVIDHGKVDWFLGQAEAERRPVAIFGTAILWINLLEVLETKGRRYQLEESSMALETGGLKGLVHGLGRDDLYAKMEAWLRIPVNRIISEYGMSELSSQAYDLGSDKRDVESRFFRFPPWARAEIVNPENEEILETPGTLGLIRVYDLANPWSAMAIQTEDLGEIRRGGFTLRGRKLYAEPRGCSLMSMGVDNL